MQVGEVTAVLSLDSTGFSRGLSDALKGISSMGAAAGPYAAVAAAAIAAVFVAKFSVDVAKGVAEGLKSAFESAATYEQSMVAFTTLLGGADEAKKKLAELSDFAKRTPFEIGDLEDSTKKMLAYGFSAEDVIPMLTDIGDTAAALGNTEAIDSMTRALGQMKSKGKVMAEEMNRQLVELGIPAWQYLADSIGVTVPEVQKMTEKGLIPADEAIQAILEGARADFGGMMAEQAKTAEGKMSNLNDSLEIFKREVGAPLVEAAKPVLDWLISALSSIGDQFKVLIDEHGEDFKAFFEAIGPLAQQVGEHILLMILTAIQVSGELIEAIQPFLPIIRAIGELSAVAWDKFSAAASVAVSGFDKVCRGIAEAIYKYIVIPLNKAIDAMNAIAHRNIKHVGQNFNIGNANSSQRSTIGGAMEFATGGIATGPRSGYPATLHGTEAILPLNDPARAAEVAAQAGVGGYVFNFSNTSRSDIPYIEAAVERVLSRKVGRGRARASLMGA